MPIHLLDSHVGGAGMDIRGNMLIKIRGLILSWYYNLIMLLLWGVAFWRGFAKGWYILMFVAAILCIVHLLMFASAMMKNIPE